MQESDPNYVIMEPSGPGLGTVILVSLTTSILASTLTVLVLLRTDVVEGMLGRGGALSGDAVVVPNVTTMTSQAADEVLKARGLRLVVREHRPDPAAAAGVVLEQTPLSDSRIQAGGEVVVIVSSGMAEPEVPIVVGQTLQKAGALIQAAHLRVGAITQVGEGGAPGTVTGTDPVAGTQLTANSEVSLTVVRATLEVPRVLGKSIRLAKEEIAAAGFKVGRVRERYDERRLSYVVLEQDPEAGEQAPTGAAINLVINEGD